MKKINIIEKLKKLLKRKKGLKKVKKTLPKKPFLLIKKNKPIITPQKENNWEAWQTFNPAAIVLDNKVHFLYRAIGIDGISRLGYASSSDGFKIRERLSFPVFEHKVKNGSFNSFSFFSGGSLGGAEDPRIVRVDNEDVLYMTYTACNHSLRVGLTSIKISDFLQKKWHWKNTALISALNETHKNWVIFPEKIKGKYAILHSISPKISITYRSTLAFKKGEYIKSYYNGNSHISTTWEAWVRGVGPPPLKTRLGWLVFYHGLQKNHWFHYKVGVMVLDLNSPEKIIYRAKEPILEPDKKYENDGFKPGVVYVSGAVIKDGKLLVYYGASDSYVGVAYANLEEFLKEIEKDLHPKLKLTTLKKKHYDN